MRGGAYSGKPFANPARHNFRLGEKIIPVREKNSAHLPNMDYLDTAKALARKRVCQIKNQYKKGQVMTNEANMEKLGANLKELSSDAEAMLQATAGQTGEKMSDLRHRLSSALDSAKTTYHRIQEKTVAGAKAADKTIREHPYESIGIAAGVAFGLGLLIGVLAGRK